MANTAKQESSILDIIIGLIICIPMILVILVLALPVILYQVLIKIPIDISKQKKFFKRNEGKLLLCITTSKKYTSFNNNFVRELKEIGINDVVVFNGAMSNNSYDNYNWDQLVSRARGFPILIEIQENKISQISLKTDFDAFFKKEIDSIQLIGSIKRKML